MRTFLTISFLLLAGVCFLSSTFFMAPTGAKDRFFELFFEPKIEESISRLVSSGLVPEDRSNEVRGILRWTSASDVGAIVYAVSLPIFVLGLVFLQGAYILRLSRRLSEISEQRGGT